MLILEMNLIARVITSNWFKLWQLYWCKSHKLRGTYFYRGELFYWGI